MRHHHSAQRQGNMGRGQAAEPPWRTIQTKPKTLGNWVAEHVSPENGGGLFKKGLAGQTFVNCTKKLRDGQAEAPPPPPAGMPTAPCARGLGGWGLRTVDRGGHLLPA